jgi:hypothetical protein
MVSELLLVNLMAQMFDIGLRKPYLIIVTVVVLELVIFLVGKLYDATGMENAF